MLSNDLILCCRLLLLPSIFSSIRAFSNELALLIRWPKYWSFSFSHQSFNEYSELISFRLTGLISLLPKGLSRVFSSTRVQKHQCHVKWQVTIATISWTTINASYHCLAFLCQTYLLYAHFKKINSTIPASYQQYTHLKIMKMEFWRQWDACLRHVVIMSSVARTIAPN